MGRIFPLGTGGGLVGGGSSGSRYADAMLARSPTSYWRLGELAGASTAVDEMNRVAGTYDNATKEQDTLIVSDTSDNKSISLNGSNGRVYMGAPTSLQLQSFTYMLLHKTPASFSPAYRLMDYDTSDSWNFGRGVHWQIGSGKVGASFGNGGAYLFTNGVATLSVSTVYHLALSYDGATLKSFINGALDSSLSSAITISYTNASLFALGYVFFAGNAVIYGRGGYDEAAIFPYAMTDANILALYKSAFNLS